MSTISIKVWNRIEMLLAPIAAEIPTTCAKQRRWAAIVYNHSFNGEALAAPSPLYRLSDTVFDIDLLELHTPFGDEDYAIVRQAQCYVHDVPQLYELLSQLNIDPASFNTPWHVSHPLL